MLLCPVDSDISSIKMRTENDATFEERRLCKRLSDKDLRFHVGRIYLDGVNSPFCWLGGSWVIQSTPPAHLRALFYDFESSYLDWEDKDPENTDDNKWSRFSNFAKIVNDAVKWDISNWEVYYYYFLLLVAPPRAEKFLVCIYM